MSGSLNSVLLGETGVCKSSLNNLIVGEEVAKTSEDSEACTIFYGPYSFQVHGTSYAIWDTRGFDEANSDTEMKSGGYLTAVEQAYKLIRDLTTSGGVDLLVLCHRAGRITTTTRTNYRLSYEVFCESRVSTTVVTYSSATCAWTVGGTRTSRCSTAMKWWLQATPAFLDCQYTNLLINGPFAILDRIS